MVKAEGLGCWEGLVGDPVLRDSCLIWVIYRCVL